MPTWRRGLLLPLATLAFAFDGAAAESPGATANVDDTRLLNAGKEPQNWLIYGGGWSEQHYSPLKSIDRSEEHTSELQSPCNLVCRLLLEKKKSKSSSQ